MNLQEFKNCLDQVDSSKIELLHKIIGRYHDIIILGNGGSNAVAAHISQDYSNKLQKRVISFTDTSMMSCYANDFGWENTYVKFLDTYAGSDTLVILISSSGNSENIVNAAQFCVYKNEFIMLTGFDPNNRMRTQFKDIAKLEFHVASYDYGVVECLHEVILHTAV